MAQLVLFPSDANQIYSAGAAPSAGQIWIFDLACSLDVAETYNDNIFIRPNDPVGDFVTSVKPRILLGAGDYLLEENTFLQLNYTPEVLHFAKHNDLNTVDQDLFLEGRYRSGSGWLDLSQRYETLSGAVIDAGDRLSRSIYTTEFRAGHEFSPRFEIVSLLRQQLQTYPQHLTSWQHSIAELVKYELTPKMLMEAEVSATRLKVEDGISQVQYASDLHVKYQATPLLILYPLVGVEVSQFSSRNNLRVDPTFSIRAEYLFREWLRANLSAYKLTGTSVSTAIFEFETSGLFFEVEQQIIERYYLNLSARYESSHVQQYAPTGEQISSREDLLLELGAKLSYRFNSFCNVSVQYVLWDNNSTNPAKSFRNNQVQCAATFDF